MRERFKGGGLGTRKQGSRTRAEEEETDWRFGPEEGDEN